MPLLIEGGGTHTKQFLVQIKHSYTSDSLMHKGQVVQNDDDFVAWTFKEH